MKPGDVGNSKINSKSVNLLPHLTEAEAQEYEARHFTQDESQKKRKNLEEEADDSDKDEEPQQ